MRAVWFLSSSASTWLSSLSCRLSSTSSEATEPCSDAPGQSSGGSTLPRLDSRADWKAVAGAVLPPATRNCMVVSTMAEPACTSVISTRVFTAGQGWVVSGWAALAEAGCCARQLSLQVVGRPGCFTSTPHSSLRQGCCPLMWPT